MRLLVVENDPVSANLIDAALKSEGIISEPAETGEDVIDLAKHYNFDVIILNFRLPDMNASKVVRRLRSAKVRTPVLILLDANEIDEELRGLAMPGDYLTKPFPKSELIARIHAIVRRSKRRSEVVIRTGKLVVNLDTRSVDVDGRRLYVTGKEYSILELLSLRKGATLTKEMFLEHLYGGIDEPELKIIDVFICKLRKKIAVATGGQDYIKTVWGQGYALKDPEPASKTDIRDVHRNFQRGALAALDILNRVSLPAAPKQSVSNTRQPRIFLAHAREDKQRVRELYATLKNAGFHPWLDEVDLLPGQNWKVEIENAIRDAGVFLACLSRQSVSKQGYVQTEFRTALSAYSERPAGMIYIIPVKLDECEVPDMKIASHGTTMRDIQWVELWDDNGIHQLAKAIRHAFVISSS